MKDEKLQKAIEKVMTGKMSIRQAAEMFGVSKSTLAYHVQKAKQNEQTEQPVSHETENEDQFENDVENEVAVKNLEIETLQKENEL